MKYPICRKVDVTEEYFGHTLADPYQWVKNAQDPEVLAWVAEENAFTDRWFDQKELAGKIAELKAQKFEQPFMAIRPWGEGYAAAKNDEGSFSLYRLDRNLKPVQLIMDGTTLENYTPMQMEACPADPNYLIISGQYAGDAMMTPLVVDCREKKILKEICNVFFATWSPTMPVVYYPEAVVDAEAQKSQIRVQGYNVLTGKTQTVLTSDGIIGEIHTACDGSKIVIEVWKDYTVSYFYSFDESTGQITDITGEKAVQMKYADSIGSTHYFISKESQPTGEILAVPDGKPLQEAKTVLPASYATLDAGFAIDGKLFVLMMENVCYKLARIEGGKAMEIDLPGKMGTAAVNGRSARKVFLKYESFTDAPMLLAFDGNDVTVISRARNDDHPDIAVEQRWAPSTGDGKVIPYFLVHRKDAKADGSNPTWIYAYGGYNCSMFPGPLDPITNLDIARWVEKGGIYVLANIRGGGEFGARWHEEGMGMLKKNCYYDFIGVTQQLMADGWTRPEHITISGCSNGGLLMSTLVTMRPDLFGCVIDSVPHTDMIHFVEDDRGPMYITEYGNPRESEEMFQYLLSYSPYHNVKAVDYPAVYIQTGECDNNVPPYHGKKFAARMQELNTSDNPILLRVLAKGSHDRGSGDAYWQTIAEMQLFVEKALKL